MITEILETETPLKFGIKRSRVRKKRISDMNASENMAYRTSQGQINKQTRIQGTNIAEQIYNISCLV